MPPQYKNTQPFYFEICNLWQTQGNAQKNLQWFFIFANDPKETYFKVPALSFKIKTKSDFDNTEVKLYATYDTLPDLVATMEMYINSQQNQMIQLAGHGYTFYLCDYPTSDGIKYTTIKLSNADGNSNDFVLRTNALAFMVNTLKSVCGNIINLSLDFIKVAQNNEIMASLSLIDDNLKRINNNVTPNVITKINEPAPISKQPEEIKHYEYVPPSALKEVKVDSSVNATREDAKPETVKVEANSSMDKTIITQQEIKPSPTKDVDEMFQGMNESSGPANNFSIDSTPKPNLQTNFKEFVQNEVSKPNDVRLKEKILIHIEKAFKKEINTFSMLDMIIQESNIIQPTVDCLSILSKYTYLTHSTFIRYFQKLALITDMHKFVTKAVPMFVIKCKFDEMFTKSTSLLNETLINLYLEYRDKPNKSELDEYVYACCRFIFAPLWSTYVSVNPKYDTSDNALLKKIRSLSMMYVQTWKETFESNLDKFIYDNQLALNYKSENIVERIFNLHCPTLYECFKDAEHVTMDNVTNVKEIIQQLKETFAYEEILIDKSMDFSLLSESFLRTMKLFSKANGINNNSVDDDVLKKFTEVITTYKIENILSEFKALKALDDNDGELQKNEEN